jgi:hypothetical protein
MFLMSRCFSCLKDIQVIYGCTEVKKNIYNDLHYLNKYPKKVLNFNAVSC